MAVSGSAAIWQVSSSFSAISRAVANSGPRPITNIRAIEANGTANDEAPRSNTGRCSSICPATSSSSPASSSQRPAMQPARSASAASWLEYVLVAATASSGPAASGSTASAAWARSDSGSFVSPIVKAPPRRARSTYSSTSGVLPDCESAITVDPLRSSFAS